MDKAVKILVVDDEPYALRAVSRLLQKAGYRVSQAANGADALRRAREDAPDLILLDVVLPDIDGVEVCRRIKADPALAGSFVVLFSGIKTASEEKAGGLEAGADGYVARPISNRELLARVRAMLRIKQAEDALRASHHRLEDTLAELRGTQEQLVRQARLAAVGQLAAGAAHEFRSFLTTIILCAKLALQKSDLPLHHVQYMETIVSESEKAAGLVQQLLDFSRRSMTRVQATDLQRLVQDMVDRLRPMLPENVRLSLDVAPEASVDRVPVDPERIEQALMNLAWNARDAMPEGGQLRLSLSRLRLAPGDEPPMAELSPGEWVCLAVSDTGTGMNQGVRAHLFEPFFTTKEIGAGTGLGLAQVYGIVRQHRGHIDVETAVGVGTTFRIYLPLEEHVDQVSEGYAAVMPQGQGETILLVEDNEKLRQVGQSILKLLGYRTLVAADGREALAVYKAQGGFDLVVTDILMPEMDGKALVRELQRIDPDVKVLGITGYTGAQARGALRAAGFLDVIHKPFEIETLARAIHRALHAGVGRWT
jgi:two-component system, cell cycle sensor histidine kinase and response regulator CckA